VSELAAAITACKSGVRINVHAQPGAKHTEIMGLHGSAIKIRVHAPPVDGKANEELRCFLAEQLKVNKQAVTLYKGDKNRAKVFEIHGITKEHAVSCLLA